MQPGSRWSGDEASNLQTALTAHVQAGLAHDRYYDASGRAEKKDVGEDPAPRRGFDPPPNNQVAPKPRQPGHGGWRRGRIGATCAAKESKFASGMAATGSYLRC